MSTTLAPAAPPTPVPERPTAQAESAAVGAIRWAGRVAAILLCLLHVVATRHAINPDGISYLDVASAYARGDLTSAVDYYWSPLYSWLLALGLLVRPGPAWDAVVAHSVGFAGFLLSLFAFEWLLAEVLRARRTQREELRERGREPLPDWLVVAVGYALFVWVARWLVPLEKLTPDVLVAAAAYAGVALVLRLRRRPDSRGAAVLLGVVLGLGYLAKTVMLPLSVFFLLAVLLATRSLRPVLVVAGVLALVAGPWVAVLSAGKGRLTIGETGRLNHLWYVGNVLHPRDFGLAAAPTPAGPTRLLETPPVVACARPGAGSFPLWYDPSHYYEGVTAGSDLRVQAAASLGAVRGFFRLLATQLPAPTLAVAGLVLLTFLLRRGPASSWLGEGATGLGTWASLLIVALGALGVYVLVGVAEPRLVGPFVLLLLFGVVLALSVPCGAARLVPAPGVGVVALLATVLLVGLARDARGAAGAPATNPHARVAEALGAMGVRPGDGVATVGDTFSCYWARLAGAQVVALVPNKAVADFRDAPSEQREAVYAACARAGARVLVMRDEAGAGDDPGWERVPGTAYAVRLLAAACPP